MSRTEYVLPSVTTIPQVRFSDTDMMGHVSSMSYAAWAEVGRADLFGALADPDAPWFVLVKLTLNFHSEGHFGEAFTLSTRVARLGGKSMTIEHEIRVGERLVCSIEVVMAAFDRETRRSRAIPDNWRLAD